MNEDSTEWDDTVPLDDIDTRQVSREGSPPKGMWDQNIPPARNIVQDLQDEVQKVNETALKYSSDAIFNDGRAEAYRDIITYLIRKRED